MILDKLFYFLIHIFVIAIQTMEGEYEGNYFVDGSDESNEKAHFEYESMAGNPKSIKERIDNALEIFSNFKNRPDKSMSRSDLLALFQK